MFHVEQSQNKLRAQRAAMAALEGISPESAKNYLSGTNEMDLSDFKKRLLAKEDERETRGYTSTYNLYRDGRFVHTIPNQLTDAQVISFIMQYDQMKRSDKISDKWRVWEINDVTGDKTRFI